MSFRSGLLPLPRNVANAEELGELERLVGLCEVQAVRSGVPLPLGARRRGTGVNFALFSRHATGVRLDLFDRPEDALPSRTVILHPSRNKTGDIWHVWLDGIRSGQLYGYRVAGPYIPYEGQRFNPNKLLVDPYATSIMPVMPGDVRAALGYDPQSAAGDLSFSEVDSARYAPKCVITHEDFDWQGDQPLRHPWSSTVIYELHVRGFTFHPSAGARFPGTYRGLIDRIPYLKELGITAVELMPILESDASYGANYWGYDPLGFFAPKAGYASVRESDAALLEFKETVRMFHRAGIEVILDVVFNHTVEGNQLGPTLGLRGIDNAIYYWLADDKRFYRDFTGVGQTLRAAHPVVRDLILDALRYWVMEVHVDGFRFDLASVLGRDVDGRVVGDAPLLERIAEDPILRDIKLIAEAWDAAGAYQVGTFAQRRWAEWNGRYRDEVRRFWRGDAGMMGAFASRICGSSDLYGASGKGPECSINFVTCHDGFTLRDLVSYTSKHNEANGHQNQDGESENYSHNYGIEGPTDNPAILVERTRQMKNFFLTLAVSRGVPMLLAGDELGRTQGGNNNAYCQDNETSWVDWSLAEKYPEIGRFVRAVLAFRRAHAVLRQEAFYAAEEVTWFAPQGGTPNWDDPEARAFACLLREGGTSALYLMFNADAEPARFVLPALSHFEQWHLAVDTAAPSPGDICLDGPATPLCDTRAYTLSPRASAVLSARVAGFAGGATCQTSRA